MIFDKIFRENVSKKEKLMTYVLISLGIIFTALGLIKGLNNIEPKYFVTIAAIVGIFISGFGFVGKLFQDIAGGKKQENILNNTIKSIESTTQALEKATDNFKLSELIDSNTRKSIELSTLTNQNIGLIKKQNLKIEEYNREIDRNISLVKEINHLQSENIEETKRNITGGNSYLSLFMFPEGNVLRLVGVIGDELENSVGKYPIENLSLNVWRNGVLVAAFDQKNYNVNQEHPFDSYDLPANENYVAYSFRIFSKNKNYTQFIVFKKHTNNKWYYHLVQLHDIYGLKLRANTYESGYPKELKLMYRNADNEILQIIKKIKK